MTPCRRRRPVESANWPRFSGQLRALTSWAIWMFMIMSCLPALLMPSSFPISVLSARTGTFDMS